MKIETYIRVDGTQGILVDSVNLPAAVNPPTTCLGMSAELRLHFYQGEASEQMTAEDFSAIGAWRLSVDEDYNQSTEPILRYTSGISVDEDGTVIVNIPNVSSQKLITALGVKPSGEYIAELMGYQAGETVPIFVVQFSLNVLNRIDLEGGSESVAIEGNYYTNSQVEALLASQYVFSFSEDGENWHETQTGADTYFKIKNGSVSGAQWSDAIHIPQGADGQDGQDGTAATIAVGTVTEGEAVTVTNSGTSTAAIFDFTFPKTIQVISTIPAELTEAEEGNIYIYVGADTITYRQGDIILVESGELVLINRGCRCSEPEQSSSTPEPSSSSSEPEPSSSSSEPEPSSSSSEPEPSSSSTPEPEPEPSSSSTPEPEPSSSSSEQPTDPTKGLLRVNVTGPFVTEIWNVDHSLIWRDADTSVELSPGKHTVYFQSRPNYTMPDYIEVNIIAGQSITVTGNYIYLPSKLTVSGFAEYDYANGEYSIINSGVTLNSARYYSNPYDLYGSGKYLYMMHSEVDGYLWVIAGDEQGNDLKAYAFTDLTKTPDKVSWHRVNGGTITVTEAQG